jgi:HlyD family secretion protein
MTGVLGKVRGPVLGGIVTILVFVGCMAMWSAAAPIAGATIARGTVAPETNRKTIQHFEGGVLRAILVRNGESVATGQPLFEMEPVAVRGQLATIDGQLWRARVERLRLLAHREGRTTFDASAAGRAPEGDVEAASFLEAQNASFRSRRDAETERRNVLQAQVAQLTEVQRSAVDRQRQTRTQLASVDEELAMVRPLIAQGYLRRPRLLALERDRSRLTSDLQTAEADGRRAGEAMREKRTEMANLPNVLAAEMGSEIARRDQIIAEASARAPALRDQLSRTTVTAPEPGIITELRFRVPGAVVGPGGALVDLVPKEDRLVLDVRVAPGDIAHVRMGAVARVALLAFPSRTTPLVIGRVFSIAPDTATDPVTRETYYLTRVSIERAELETTAPGVVLGPGMPVEAYVETIPRTLVEYLLDPLLAAWRRGFREA